METERPTRRIDWYRVAIAPELMKELNQPSDLKGLFQAGGHIALVIALGAGTYWVWATQAWYWLIPALFIYASAMNMLHAGVHELIHERVFKTAWLNGLFARINSFLVWWNYRWFALSHNEHHKFTLHQPDDEEVVLPQKLNAWNVINAFIFNPMVAWQKPISTFNFAAGRKYNSWQQHVMGELDPKTRRWVLRWSWFLLLGHGTIVAVSLYFGQWIIPLLTTFVGCYGGAISMLTGAPQHIGLVDEVNDFRLCCRTFKTNRLFSFLYWNMNYHIEHHMYPVVPCYNLPKLHEAIKHELPHTPQNIWATWVQIAYILDRQKREPEYEYRAPLPTDEVVVDPVAGSAVAAIKAIEDDTITTIAKVWECALCGFIYDEQEGLPEEGIEPGTAWADIPEDWICPVCGVAKAQFKMIEISRKVAKAKQNNAQGIDAFADPIVIVGSGIAGYSVAREIRKHNPDQPIVIITRDGGESYYKPMLSNALMNGKHADDLVLHEHGEMAEQLNAKLMTHTTVSAIDRASKTITTNTESIRYHKLVLALGADPMRLPLQGDAADAVLSVNDLDDFRKFSQSLPADGKVLIIGAGLIGCEFANDLALSGHKVEVVDITDQPLGRLLPPSLGESLRDRLQGQGVSWHFGRSIQSVQHGDGSAIRCVLDDGQALEADLVLSAVGLRPRVQLAQEAGLSVGKGIVINDQLATSDPDIFAVGDCVEIDGQPLPFVMPIMHEAKAIGLTLSGEPTPVRFPVMPVAVKTHSCPVVVAPPKPGAAGAWQVDGEDAGVARFIGEDGVPLGFALLGEATSHVEALVQEMPEPTGAVAGEPVMN